MSEQAAVDSGTVADRRVHPGTIALRFIREVPSTVLAAPAAIAFASDIGIAGALSIAAVIAAVLIGINWLAWSRFRYGVGARDIVIESGILNRNRRSIPFDRVQDVDLERQLLARLFGLAKVRIETGGGGKDEGVIDSVSVAEADRLRSAVRAGRDSRAVAASPETGAEAQVAAGEPGRLLFAMSVPRVLLLGLTNFSLVYIAGLFALLQSFDSLLPFDIYDPARWMGLLGPYVSGRFTPGAILAVLLLAVLLGIVAGLVRTLAREYGFRLSDEGTRLRRERGLLTHTEVVLGKRRVQLAFVQTGPLRRLLGWFELFFQSLGAGADGGGRQSAAPLARSDEIEPILASTGRFRLPDPSYLVPVSRRHALRALVGPILIFAVAASAAAVARTIRPDEILAPAWALPLALFPFLAVYAGFALLGRRFHLYGIDDGILFVRRGVWRQRLWIVPLRGIQTIGLSRTPPQRWLGLATLSVDTAGAPVTGGVRIVDLRGEAASELLTRLAADRHSSGRKSGTDR